jgi:hypothetical protein
MPPVTADHLHRAFEVLAYRGTTFDAAMADPLRRQVLTICAKSLLRHDYEQTTRRTVVPERRIRLGVDGHPIGWVTHMADGPRAPITQPPLF